MKHIGIIGAGIMASGMVRNFLQQGYVVHVWNRSPERLEPLTKAGASAEVSPKTVAAATDIVIECVSDDEASRAVWLGDEGILAGASADAVLITAATLSIAWTDELARLCKTKGFEFLDIPLTGSRKGAETGTLKLLVGGDRSVLDKVRPELDAISDKIYYFGPSGSGMRFKLVLNALQAIQVDAVSQAIILVKKAGLDIKDMQHALFDAPMGPASPAVNTAFVGYETSPEVTWAVKLVEKDLRYAQAMTKDYGLDINLLNETHDDYKRATSSGLADRDWTAIVEMYDQKG